MSAVDRLEDALGASSNRNLDAELSRARICVRCGLSFCELTNIGSWSCSYHPAAYVATAHTQTYRCCNRHVSSEGCVPADHTDLYELNVAPTPIPTDMAEAVRAAQAARHHMTRARRSGKPLWLYDTAERQWFVARVDSELYENHTSIFGRNQSFHSEHKRGFSAKELCL